MHRTIFLIVAAAFVLTLPLTECIAQPPMGIPREARKEPTPGQWRKALFGGQLGPWFTKDLGNDIATPTTRLDASGTAFHLEFFYQPNIVGIMNLEFSVGAINRGDMRVRDADFIAFADVTLYPLNAGVVIYPLAKMTDLKVQPSLVAGGSLVLGTTRNLSENSQFYSISTDTRTALGFYAGGGANLVLSPSFCLKGTVKYQQAKFDKDLFGARDYSGMLVLIGAAYMYR